MTLDRHGASLGARVTSGAAIVAASLTLSAPARATDLGPPSSLISVYALPGMGRTTPGAGALGDAYSLTSENLFGDTFSDTAAALVVSGPVPSLTVSVAGTGYTGNDETPEASATLGYRFMIDGPRGSTAEVPIVAGYRFSSGFSDNAIFATSGYIQVQSAHSGPFIASICPFLEGECESTAVGMPSSNLTGRKLFLVNDPISVSLVATVARISTDRFVSYSGDVYVDPTFTIDPTFLAENPGYSLEFSPGVGNSAPGVPEPAAWITMLLGIGGLGLALRERRKGVNRPESRETAAWRSDPAH